MVSSETVHLNSEKECKQGPFLSGKRLYLRALQLTDLKQAYFDWFNDAEICRYTSHGRYPNSEKKMKDYIENLTPLRDLCLAIIQKDTDRHIGNVALQLIDPYNRSAEFAIMIGDKNCWGKGYAKEAGRLILRHGFQELNLHRIHCGTLEDNTGMISLAKSLGMTLEGRRRQGYFREGRYFDALEFGLLVHEFSQN